MKVYLNNYQHKLRTDRIAKNRFIFLWVTVCGVISFVIFFSISGLNPFRVISLKGIWDTSFRVDLYFAAVDDSRLVAEHRKIYSEREIEQRIKATIEELILGPISRDLKSPLPRPTRVGPVWVVGRTAYINFTPELVKSSEGGLSGELNTIFSIVHTVTRGFRRIHWVKILIEGKERMTLRGHCDIGRTLSAKDDILLRKAGVSLPREVGGEIHEDPKHSD